MAKITAVILGVVLLLLGLIGFVLPNLAGTHLTVLHNLIHLIAGAAALYIGIKGSLPAARLLCFGLGIVFLLLGVIGYWFGLTHYESLPPEMSDGLNARMFRIIPGYLELGKIDHYLHIALGAVFIVSGFLTRETKVIQVDSK